MRYDVEPGQEPTLWRGLWDYSPILWGCAVGACLGVVLALVAVLVEWFVL